MKRTYLETVLFWWLSAQIISAGWLFYARPYMIPTPGTVVFFLVLASSFVFLYLTMRMWTPTLNVLLGNAAYFAADVALFAATKGGYAVRPGYTWFFSISNANFPAFELKFNVISIATCALFLIAWDRHTPVQQSVQPEVPASGRPSG